MPISIYIFYNIHASLIHIWVVLVYWSYSNKAPQLYSLKQRNLLSVLNARGVESRCGQRHVLSNVSNACVLSCCCIQLCALSMTVIHHAPVLGFSKQNIELIEVESSLCSPVAKSLSFKKKNELLLWWAWVWFLVGELFLMAHESPKKKNWGLPRWSSEEKETLGCHIGYKVESWLGNQVPAMQCNVTQK